jgi:hypothetical protein
MRLIDTTYIVTFLCLASSSSPSFGSCDVQLSKKHDWLEEEVCGRKHDGHWCVPPSSGFNGFMNCKNRAMTHCPTGTACRMYGPGAASCIAEFENSFSDSSTAKFCLSDNTYPT